jgi:hypothetical protein
MAHCSDAVVVLAKSVNSTVGRVETFQTYRDRGLTTVATNLGQEAEAEGMKIGIPWMETRPVELEMEAWNERKNIYNPLECLEIQWNLLACYTGPVMRCRREIRQNGECPLMLPGDGGCEGNMEGEAMAYLRN